jgi:hypothetical protein
MAVKATMRDVRQANEAYSNHVTAHKCRPFVRLEPGEALCPERVALLEHARRLALLWNVPADERS